MRTTTTNRWVWVFAGALPVIGLGAGCGDDTTTTGTTSGAGGFGGFGGGDATQASSSAGTPTSSSSGSSPTSSSSSGTPASSSSGGDGGSGGTGGSGGGGTECGNGLLEDGEDCDGDQVGDATCATEGFFDGTIGCTAQCELDTSECTNCGNDEADAGEQCDGDDLDGNDCTDAGDFIGGALACANDCTFDTLGCVGAECGDGEINGNDECEVGNLDGEDCVSQGFVSGTLTCTNCQFDTSTCISCGDGEITGNDVCDGADLGGEDCTTVPGNFTGGTLGCDNDCAGYDTTACTNFPQPGVGELVITEMMMNPTGTPVSFPDESAEWFEINNPSASTTFQLRGCVVSTRTEAPFTITTDLSIAPGENLTFAKSTPGFTADYTYPNGFNLANGVNGDFLTITCDGVEVDTVDYNNAAGWSVPAGRSLSLDPSAIDAGDNDEPENWCNATTVGAGFTSGDLGTPGEANPSCSGGELTIGFCRLQFPTSIDDTEGTSYTVYGRVYVAGLTDVNTSGNDINALLVGSLGYGPDGSNPSLDTTGWSFIAATPNAGYTGAEPNNDEYQATFNLPGAAGSPYDYAFRFSGDGGTTWTYCDTNGDVYAPADAGQLVCEPSNVDYTGLYFSEYIEAPSGNGNNKVLELHNDSGAPIDLAACELRLYNDGSGNPNSVVDATFNLTTNGPITLAAGEELVICHNQATHVAAGICDVTIGGGVMNFNGDDTVGLWCGGNPIDVIGQIGVDPGTAFGAGGITTADRILRRSCDVTVGDSDPTDAFDPAAEWTATTYDQTTMDDDLGAYVCP